MSCIDPTICTALGLVQTGTVGVLTPSTGAVPHQVPAFDVSFYIPGAAPVSGGGNPGIIWSRAALPVTSSPLLHQGFGVLLGRDVLSDGLMVFDGRNNLFTLCF